MSEDEGFTIELTAKQAAVTFLFVGLVFGGASGLVAGAFAFGGDTQLSGNDGSGGESGTSTGGSDSGSEFVSLDGVEFEGEPSKGDSDAPIKIVEVNEFGCPFCAEFQGIDASGRIPIDQMDVAGQIESQYVDTGEVQVISKDYPVPRLHPNGPEAHKAANCVYEHEKDSYWSYFEELFERRDQWMASGQGNTEDTFRQISKDLGLDTETVMQCYDNSENQEANNDKSELTTSVGRLGTPTFFVGNRDKGFVKLSGAQPLPRFEEAINTVQNQ
jgi:protein-disulfide isomerase